MNSIMAMHDREIARHEKDLADARAELAAEKALGAAGYTTAARTQIQSSSQLLAAARRARERDAAKDLDIPADRVAKYLALAAAD